MWYLMKCCAPINELSNLIKYCRTNKCMYSPYFYLI